MQYALLIYQGTTPLPNTEAWSTLSEAEQQAIYADYGKLNSNPAITPALPLGLPEQAKTVRVDNGKTITTNGPLMGTEGAIGGPMGLEGGHQAAAVRPA